MKTRILAVLTVTLANSPLQALPPRPHWAVPAGPSAGVPSIGEGAAVNAPAAQRANLDTEGFARRLAQQYPQIPQAAVQKVLRYMKERSVRNMKYITIIDFNKPSDARRMYIIRTSDAHVESHLVAHGSGSGDRYATKFSNTPNSHQSSLGLYITAGTYAGKHGRSLKLEGMEASNNKAMSRSVVIHGAGYVSDAYARENKRVGRSWGCPAVDMKYRDHIIDMIQGGSVLLIHKE